MALALGAAGVAGACAAVAVVVPAWAEADVSWPWSTLELCGLLEPDMVVYTVLAFSLFLLLLLFLLMLSMSLLLLFFLFF